MKIDHHDQAKILSALELSQLFTIGLKRTRDRASASTPQPILLSIILLLPVKERHTRQANFIQRLH